MKMNQINHIQSQGAPTLGTLKSLMFVMGTLLPSTSTITTTTLTALTNPSAESPLL